MSHFMGPVRQNGYVLKDVLKDVVKDNETSIRHWMDVPGTEPFCYMMRTSGRGSIKYDELHPAPAYISLIKINAWIDHGR